MKKYVIDELANIVAMANSFEQIALTEDIRTNGQQESAVLWRGKLVDGRCRQLACMTLDKELKVRELDSKLTRSEVAEIVKSLNTRRNLTDMQKAMSAYKQQETNGLSNEKIAKKWGIPFGTYKNAKYICVNRPDLVESLFNGKSIRILDPDSGREITTSKINTLARIIKKTKELDVVKDSSEEVSFEWSSDALIKTEAGKKWFTSKMKQLNLSESSLEIRMDYVELANYKYKVEK